LLDIDHGTYPFVTSSSPCIGGVGTGLGISPREIGEIIGIAKAYCTRVGSGPFPTELTDKLGDQIRENGREFGTTTGRPRRCGWIDIVALKHAIWINGFTSLVITKLDVLDTFDSLNICVKYENEGKQLDDFPSDPSILNNCRPVYETFPGWKISLSNIKDYSQLPENTKKFLDRIETLTGIPIFLVSVGAERGETLRK
jgi:adenylosuccinate synthase